MCSQLIILIFDYIRIDLITKNNIYIACVLYIIYLIIFIYLKILCIIYKLKNIYFIKNKIIFYDNLF